MNFIQHRGLGNGDGKNSKSTARTRALTWIVAAAFATGAGVPSAMHGAHAQSATWNGETTSYNDDLNWVPQTEPTGTATFSESGSLQVDFVQDTTLNTLLFNAPGRAYTFNFLHSTTVNLNGEGIVNTSGNRPLFNIDAITPNSSVLFFPIAPLRAMPISS